MEKRIMEKKVDRVDPQLKLAILALKDIYDRHVWETLDSTINWAEKLFVDTPAEGKKIFKMSDLNFFSQFVPEFGMRFTIEMVFRCDPKKVYIAVCSLNPPGSLYDENPEFEKAVLFTGVDFNSKMSGQKFAQPMFTFKNLPLNPKLHMIIDIKEFDFGKK